MLDDLTNRIKQHNTKVRTNSADAVIATPEWVVDKDHEGLRHLLCEFAIRQTQDGPVVIPQAAKELKAVGVELVVTRLGKATISVVAHTAFGVIVVWWDRAELLAWLEIHETIHPYAVEEPAPALPVTAGEGIVIEERGFFERMGSAIDSALSSKRG
jgi:hypothetical protein